MHKLSMLGAASVLALTLATPALAQSPSGIVQGRVTSSETGANLVGAHVRVVGASLSADTDGTGAFSIAGVPSGPQTLSVSYIGLPTQTLTVQVMAGGSGEVAIALGGGEDATQVEEIVVRSQRVARDEALNRYRASDAIANYVAADDIGQFVDQNVAESLSRLPGVSITRDQGEGRFVSVRGVPPGLSTVTINGMRIGTPEDSDRAVPLDVIPAGSIDLLEITKVPTPNMPGDAIGGAIDVRSGSPFTESRRYNWRYRAETSYSELSQNWNGEARLNFADVFSVAGGENNFGVSAGINYLSRDYRSDNIEAVYDTDGLGRLVLEEVDQRAYQINRERLGVNLNLEFRPSANDTFYANSLFTSFTDAETRQRNGFVFSNGTLASFDGTAGTYTGIPASSFRRRVRYRTKDQDTLALSFGGEHQRGLWALDYQLGYSAIEERVPDEIEMRFNIDQGGSTRSVNFTQGSGRPSFQVFGTGGVADTSYLQNVNAAFDRIIVSPLAVDDTDVNLRANIERAEAFGVSGLTLSAGVDYRSKDKDANVDEVELRRGPTGLRASQFTSPAPGYGLGLIGQGLTGQGALSYFQNNRALFTERPQDADGNAILMAAEDYNATEDVTAGYAMGTWDFGQWRVIAGVRVEHTSFEATGNEVEVDADGDLTITPRSGSSDYTSVLPGLHVRYEPMENLVVRAAWSNTIGRPSFGDLSPRFQINFEDEEIDMGNPDLDPYEASNLDLMVDWYPGGESVLSVGVFRKDIDGYIVDITQNDPADFPGFEVTRPVNGTSAQVTGVEFNVEQGLGVFGDMFSPFLIGANLTLLDTEFTVAGRDTVFPLPQAAETTGNLYLGYEAGPISARVSYAYRSEYLEEIGDDENFDVWVRDSNQLDFTASYRFSPAVEVVFEAQNLLNDPLELYQGTEATSLQFEEYGRVFTFGLKGRF